MKFERAVSRQVESHSLRLAVCSARGELREVTDRQILHDFNARFAFVLLPRALDCHATGLQGRQRSVVAEGRERAIRDAPLGRDRFAQSITSRGGLRCVRVVRWRFVFLISGEMNGLADGDVCDAVDADLQSLFGRLLAGGKERDQN